MVKSIAVLISDVHYSLKTLDLADAALRQAVDKANSLKVPLIVAGDLHDTKANLRAECVNAMIDTLSGCLFLKPYILIGNHDKINEKSENNALNFLDRIAIIVNKPRFISDFGWLIPYQHDTKVLKAIIKGVKKEYLIIMHQGLSGSDSGEYIQDKTAITHKDVSGRRVISGHYHTRQTITLPKGGTWDYIGNPYTLNFAEANDPEKGYQILYGDNSLEFVPTNLRKHVIIGRYAHDIYSGVAPEANEEDVVLVNITGTREQLNNISKEQVKDKLLFYNNFKLNLIPTDIVKIKPKKAITQAELLDSMITDLQDITDDRKQTIKDLWKNL